LKSDSDCNRGTRLLRVKTVKALRKDVLAKCYGATLQKEKAA
jgi:translation elongation factor EF-4